jgi:hypothetical protein
VSPPPLSGWRCVAGAHWFLARSWGADWRMLATKASRKPLVIACRPPFETAERRGRGQGMRVILTFLASRVRHCARHCRLDLSPAAACCRPSHEDFHAGPGSELEVKKTRRIFRWSFFRCPRTWWGIGGGKKHPACATKQSALSDAGHRQGRPALERPLRGKNAPALMDGHR